MSWAHVARKDFADASRSKLLWGLTVILLLLVAGLSVIPYLLDSDGSVAFGAGLTFVFGAVGFLIPIIGLVVGYRSIVGERESGSIRFLLGLPNSRRDVVIGKVIGRAIVVAVPTIFAFIVGAIVIYALYTGFEVINYLGLFVFTLIMGLVYVAIAVSVSASVSSRAKAVAGVLVYFIVFEVLWTFILMAVYWLVNGKLPLLQVPAWYVFLERLTPGGALSAVGLALINAAGGGSDALSTASRVIGEVPFYLDLWVSWVVIIAWIVVPLALGYLRFRKAALS